uniref:Putative secreted protein n=1 Tax=Rhipicephalus microplus TaxID=6941 RepID=A0A6G5A2M1_RHIMP
MFLMSNLVLRLFFFFHEPCKAYLSIFVFKNFINDSTVANVSIVSKQKARSFSLKLREESLESQLICYQGYVGWEHRIGTAFLTEANCCFCIHNSIMLHASLKFFFGDQNVSHWHFSIFKGGRDFGIAKTGKRKKNIF